MDNKLIMKPGE